ncbi:hypothetical protein H4Q26_010990 [Puccinia striiformis f. sp. tritici PST-130]|nr:hypothetical protein H4Q26_010990 [Puccinia striiformis f. sp. tritici PST-130]
MFKHLFKASLLIASVVLAVSLELFSVPKVELDYGSFIGKLEPILQLERFYGIPFAEPPVGELRFANPIKPTKTYFNRDATKLPPACPQQTFGGNTSSEPYHSLLNGAHLNPLAYIKAFGPGQEDCLTLDITRPAGTTNSSRLPVIPWGLQLWRKLAANSEIPGQKSMDMGMPVIHVTANHRLNAFGFLGGKEVGEAGVGNLGLKDQRLTMEWIKTHISQFGGDPDKVTIYGESSGAISVSHHLLAFKGQHNNLFRAAICHSGTAIPIGKLSDGAGQHAFDHIAQFVDCGDASDKLACLRKAPYKKLLIIFVRRIPLTFAPVVDGDFVTESMQTALKAGEFAKVPVITGDTLDEGTIFTLGTLPLRTEDDLRAFITKKLPGLETSLSPIDCLVYADVELHRPSHAVRPNHWSIPCIGPACPLRFYTRRAAKGVSDSLDRLCEQLKSEPSGTSEWPTYDKGGQNLIIDQHGADGVKPDDFRKEAIEFYLSNIDALTFISQ